MAVQVARPKIEEPVITPGKKGSDKWGKGLGIGLGAVGGAIGAIGGGPAGAMGGLSGGMGIGASVGGMLDKKAKEGSISQPMAQSASVPTSESSISRRLASQQGDSLASLSEGLQALGRSEPNIQQEYGPPIFQAFMQDYNQRNKKGVV